MEDHPKSHESIEPIVKLLFGAVVLFTLLLIGISKWSPNDGQTFQVISSLLAGFAGALFMRIKPADPKPKSVGTTERGDVNITEPAAIRGNPPA